MIFEHFSLPEWHTGASYVQSYLTDDILSLNNTGFVNHNLFFFIGTWGNLGCVSPVSGSVSTFN